MKRQKYKFDNLRKYYIYFRVPFTKYFICKDIMYGYYDLCCKYWNAKKGGYSWRLK